jgi:hypothetical protein
MSIQLQHLLVLVIVSGAFAFVAWQALRSLRGKSSSVGSCCSRGCGETMRRAEQPAAVAPPPRVVFLPVERLTRKK